MAPVILATDKTQLTQFSGNKAAYPVYLTLGNLPKATRRKPSKNACVLIAYLSVQKLSKTNLTVLDHRSRMQRVFHESMRIILKPLEKAGLEGVKLASSNGDVRLVHPILTTYVADYPEQCLVACSKYGTCPKCRKTAKELAKIETSTARTGHWTIHVIEEAKKTSAGSHNTFHDACMAQDVAGGVYVPFWKNLPFTDIHKCVTPDILHQIYQGIFKHIVAWCQIIVPSKELDARISRLPFGQGLRWFKNGISDLSQVSGSERKNMAKILLGCVHDLLPPEGVNAVRYLLDFIYLAQYSTHNTETLSSLTDALNNFHKNKDYFIKIGIHPDLHIPKLHSLSHYVESIELFGTTDNYNTEMFERLHIDFAKLGWRSSNQRDEFPQMIRWLSRQEKINRLQYLISARTNPNSGNHLSLTQRLPIYLAKRPQLLQHQISLIVKSHCAPDLEHYLKKYLNSFLRPALTARRLETIPLPITTLDVYKSFRFRRESFDNNMDESIIIRAAPPSQDLPSGQFDTVILLNINTAESTGLAGTFLLAPYGFSIQY